MKNHELLCVVIKLMSGTRNHRTTTRPFSSPQRGKHFHLPVDRHRRQVAKRDSADRDGDGDGDEDGAGGCKRRGAGGGGCCSHAAEAVCFVCLFINVIISVKHSIQLDSCALMVTRIYSDWVG